MNQPEPPTQDNATGASDFVTEAYNLQDSKSMSAFYAKWAQDYDHKMLGELSYISPAVLNSAVQNQLPDKDSVILDVGCGTGLTALGMAQAGYKNLYGIDLSQEMVNVAHTRNIYADLQVGNVNDPLNYENEFFHGILSTGTFTHGHVGPEPLDELCRILKSEGILACTVHQDLWQERGFEQKFQQLVCDSVLQCLSLTLGKYYEDGEPEGWFCIYQKG